MISSLLPVVCACILAVPFRRSKTILGFIGDRVPLRRPSPRFYRHVLGFFAALHFVFHASWSGVKLSPDRRIAELCTSTFPSSKKYENGTRLLCIGSAYLCSVAEGGENSQERYKVG